MKTTRQVNYSCSVLFILAAAFLIVCSVGNPAWAAGQLVKTSTIEKAGLDFIFNILEWDKNRLDIKVTYDGKQIRLPEGNVNIDCKLPGRKRRIGRVHFVCMVNTSGHATKRVSLYADVKVFYNIYRPIRSLKMGHVMQPGDIELTQLKSDHILRNIVSNDEDIIGHRLIRNLDEGETLLAHMVQKIPLVKNGDRILIIAHKGPLRVTAPGVIRQNGFKNDTVRVENLQSRKIILGTVIDSRTIQINF